MPPELIPYRFSVRGSLPITSLNIQLCATHARMVIDRDEEMLCDLYRLVHSYLMERAEDDEHFWFNHQPPVDWGRTIPHLQHLKEQKPMDYDDCPLCEMNPPVWKQGALL